MLSPIGVKKKKKLPSEVLFTSFFRLDLFIKNKILPSEVWFFFFSYVFLVFLSLRLAERFETLEFQIFHVLKTWFLVGRRILPRTKNLVFGTWKNLCTSFYFFFQSIKTRIPTLEK